MKKTNVLITSLISIILFNIFFIIILIYYNNIIILVNGFFKSMTKEYYLWFLSRPNISMESTMLNITEFLKMIFSLIFLIEFLYIISNEKYIKLVNKKNTLISLIIGSIIYCLSFIFIKYKAEHYRLFMTLISTEILSIILLNLVLKIKKKIAFSR
ncbi:MAG: hypothetical protein E6916_06530 [Clostridium cochlearium]|uniref:Uncharacterized protein n=1 Tax=Clostridium cochlearium TaxID=1494 RepID=A0A7Y3XXU8_CLOCO|nr:hypothetical protein [Clostridium cochlearium]MDU1443156.1 hypothetical protein [Clostridium cochlearium]NOH14827.1 hypothetical protein [Clostridium cochlearium]